MHWRVPAVVVAALALLSCAPPVRPAPSAATRVVPFHAVSRTIYGRVTSSFPGTAYVYDDEIRVLLHPGGYSYLRPTSEERRQRLSATLAYGDTAAAWNVRVRSGSRRTSELPARADTLADTVVFRISGTRGLDLQSHWIMIWRELEVSIDGRWTFATQPVHADLRMFR